MRLLFLFAIVILFALGCTAATKETKNETKIIQERPSLGKAPDFELQDLNSRIVKLSDFRGQKVIINFFATWCPPCKEEMPLFERVHKENPEIAFIAINLQEDAETVRSFINGMNITYIVLLDSNAKAKRGYKLITQPQTFFIDESGNLVDKKIGVYTKEEFLSKFEAFRLKNIAAVGTKESKPEEEIKTKDGVKYIVDPDTITTVLNKDAIPSLTNPNFENTNEADKWLNENDIGVGVSQNGATKFYPFRIMSRHEIVNDFFGNEPVIITYCPLCRTGIVFNRQVDGQTLEFGVSGKLYNSEVVMYDRKTGSYWLQTPGKAVVGELTGKVMKRLPSDVSTYGDWKATYPNTQVLSRNTGHYSVYSGDPYEGYDKSNSIWYPVQARNDVLVTKELVLGINLDGKSKAYVVKKLKEEKLVNDNVGSKVVLVLYDSNLKSSKLFSRQLDGKILEFKIENEKITSAEGNEINLNGEIIEGPDKGRKLENLAGIEHFWFSWYAFYPDTEIYK